jgi:heat shock protein HslJ
MHETTWLKWGTLALAGAAALLLVVVAFNTSDDIEGRTWVAEEIAIDGSLTPLVANTVVTAAFEDGSVSGIASCNNYFGGYEVDGDAITFGALGSTLMACEPAVMDQEQAYLAALAAADRFAVDGSTMTLYAGDTALVEYAEADTD